MLFIFSERDNLVGDPEAARALVFDVPDARVEIIGTGHLMGAEQPAVADSLILGFFKED